MITVADLCAHLDGVVPFAWAAPWDRVGLLVGDPASAITGVLVSLDPTHGALERATAAGANVLVTHHPAFLDPLEVLVADPGSGGVAFEAARRGIALIACHTNLDRARVGADALPAVLGFAVSGPLESRDDPTDVTPRAGRLCDVGVSSTLGALADRVAERLGVGVRVWGDPARDVAIVAIAPGSGRSLVEAALAAGADALVTGELRYHVAHDALERGLAVIEAGHDATEWPLTHALARLVGEAAGLDQTSVFTDGITYPWRMVTKGSECTQRAHSPNSSSTT